MAVTGYWYTKAISGAFGGDDGSVTAKFNWEADSASIKVALMSDVWSASTNQQQTAADNWNDISAYEITAFTNYTAGGKAITAASTLTTSAGSGKTITFDAPDVVWSTATLTSRGAVVYKATGTASTSPVLGYLDFGADVPANSGDFTITWHSDGIATITVS